MKLSLRWLSDYVDLSGLSGAEIAAQLTMKVASIDAVHRVGEDIREVQDRLDLTYEPIFRQNPPPGFNGPEEIRVLLGSVKRLVD